MNCAGVILCGGESRRMGRPKVTLPFGNETMLARVARLLGKAVEPVLVVAGARQQLPDLPPAVEIVRDRREGRGPLEAMAVGLLSLGSRAEAAYVTGCDVPLLRPQFVSRMIELAAGYEIAVPHVGGYDEPLCGVYRTGVVAEIESLLAQDRLRPALLFERVATRRVTAEELIGVDEQLHSLMNINTPADYEAALGAAGIGGSGKETR